MRAVVFSLIAVVSWSCRGGGLSNADGEVQFAREAQHLGAVYRSLGITGSITVYNRGRSPMAVTWEEPEGFLLVSPPSVLEAGETKVGVALTHDAPGIYRGVLEVSASNSGDELLLIATVLDFPECQPSTPCSTWNFDPALGECVETVLPDDTVCDPRSACVQDATCQGGRCVGPSIVCDDGNACTLNTCNAVTGCEFPPAPPCPGDGACGVGVCDPATGCTTTPAEDGTVCGEGTCVSAKVCIDGTCVERDPPDGFVCAEPTPCREAGVCQGATCVQPPATPVAYDWSFNAPDPTGQTVQKRLHDFVIEPDGRMSMMGFFATTVINGGTTAMREIANTASRRCLIWNGRLTCADHREYDVPGEGLDGAVKVLDENGLPLWRFRLAQHRPQFLAENQNLFMARMVVMGPDRLAAVYEAYPANLGSETRCRNYYMAVLNASGELVNAHKLVDPLLTQCNHPHPYGAVADAAGNLYLSFSPSSEGNAPLAAQNPTLLISWDKDGIFRWKRVDGYPGGELGVVGELLFSEGSQTPLDAKTGIPLQAQGGPRELMGRPVVTKDHYVSSPWMGFGGGTEMHGYAHTSRRQWTYTLPAPTDTFLTRELRLASWHPRPEAQRREVVLTFARINGVGTLVAVDPSMGKEAFRCELQAPIMDAPQLFEVANDRLAVMGDALTLGDGDPPFANSYASFWRFLLPGISPSRSPWPGTWGGPTHDHREKGTHPSTPGSAAQ